MNLVIETLKTIQHEAANKANHAIAMQKTHPENKDFLQGQYQAFSEIYTMIDILIKKPK